MNIKTITIMIAFGFAVNLCACKRDSNAEVPDFDSENPKNVIHERNMSYSRSAYKEGRKQAQRDIQQGTLAIEGFGLPAPWSNEYEAILEQRYGIKSVYVAGCVVNGNEFGHARGYNAVMMLEIKRRFGEDVFKKTTEEAIRLQQQDETKEKDMGGKSVLQQLPNLPPADWRSSVSREMVTRKSNPVEEFGTIWEDSERESIARESNVHRGEMTVEDSERFGRKMA